MKIVINDCYGGFSLSHKAVMRYAELKGIKLYPFIDDIHKEVYKERATLDNPAMLIHYGLVPEEELERMEAEESKKPIAPNRYEKTNAAYFSERDISRTDVILLKVIKELKGEASRRCAKLKIIEIPDDVDGK